VSKFKVVPIEDLPGDGRCVYRDEYAIADGLKPGKAYEALVDEEFSVRNKFATAASLFAKRNGRPWRVMRRGNSVWIERPN
jgi:hypothetical protein